MIRKSIQYISCAILAGASLLSLGAYADINDSGVKVKWGYIGNLGPERWGQLDPGFAACSKGKSQSPVNIPKKVKALPGALAIKYLPASVGIVEDGATDLLLNGTHTIIDDGHGLQINFHDKQNQETITVNGKDYHLVQFHIHTPSETEWHNQTFPMEIHFVHQSDDGTAAVIGVFVNGGEANKTLQKIIANVPKDKGIDHPLENDQINPGDLLPAQQDYYSFMGSLTTPPCTEGLQWIVMAKPITASPAQIVKLRQANGGVNARPVQPLNKRVVSFSAETK